MTLRSCGWVLQATSVAAASPFRRASATRRRSGDEADAEGFRLGVERVDGRLHADGGIAGDEVDFQSRFREPGGEQAGHSGATTRRFALDRLAVDLDRVEGRV